MTKHKQNAIQAKRDRPADKLGASRIEVTPEMIEAGFRTLCASGLADEYLLADKVLVAEIFDAMLRARPEKKEACASSETAPQ